MIQFRLTIDRPLQEFLTCLDEVGQPYEVSTAGTYLLSRGIAQSFYALSAIKHPSRDATVLHARYATLLTEWTSLQRIISRGTTHIARILRGIA